MLLFSSNTISIPNNQRRKLRLRISSFPKVTSFVAVQLLSHVWFFAIPWAAVCQASLSFAVSWNFLKLLCIESVLLSNHPIFCCPLLLLPSIFPSIRVFFHWVKKYWWPKYWCFSFSISPSNEYSGLISFRVDWFDLLAVQETLKNLLQHHNSKASFLQHSAFFMVQISGPYMTTGKTRALIIWIFVCKVISLLFNMLSRFVIACLPRSKCLLYFMAAVTTCSDLGAQENKICHRFHFFPFCLTWSNGAGCHNLSFLNAEF